MSTRKDRRYDRSAIPSIMILIVACLSCALGCHSGDDPEFVVLSPSTPASLLSRGISSYEIELTWIDPVASPDLNEDGYQVERSVDAVNFTLLGTTAQDATVFVDRIPPTPPEQLYYYRIRAFRGTTNFSDYSNISSNRAILGPENLVVHPINHGCLNLTWDDLSQHETGYSIERSRDGQNFSPMAMLAADVTSFDDDTVIPQQRFWYRVTAFNAVNSQSTPATRGLMTPEKPWAATLAGRSADEAQAICPADDGYYVTGSTESFSVNGSAMWIVPPGQKGARPMAIRGGRRLGRLWTRRGPDPGRRCVVGG